VRSERLVLSVGKDGFVCESPLDSWTSSGRFHDVVVSEGNSISRLSELAGCGLAESVHELSILSSVGECNSAGITGSHEDEFHGLKVVAAGWADGSVVGADQSVGIVEEDRNNISDSWEGGGESGGVEVIGIRKSESGFQPLNGSFSYGFQFIGGDRNGVLDGLIVVEDERDLVQIVNLVVDEDEDWVQIVVGATSCKRAKHANNGKNLDGFHCPIISMLGGERSVVVRTKRKIW